jgi:hypothetical protein
MINVTNWKITIFKNGKSSCSSSISLGHDFRGYAKSPEGNRAVILDISDIWLLVLSREWRGCWGLLG